MESPDEGFNLGKAALVAVGQSPYGRMWNDQPPILTYVLAAAQSVAPGNVAVARGVILASACLMLWSLYRLVYRSAGHVGAIAATILLATGALFTEMSVAVLIGLPAIALAIVAMDIATASKHPRLWLLIAAGVVMGLSLQTKLFTLAALPALGWLVWAGARELTVPRRLRNVAVVAASVGVSFFVVVLISGEPVMTQLVRTHVNGQLRGSYSLATSLADIWDQLQLHLPLLLALAVAALLGFSRGFTAGIAPLLWLVIASVSLAAHTPIWSHQVLLIIVPMAWLAGLGLPVLMQHKRGWPIGLALIAALLVASGVVGFANARATFWKGDGGFIASGSLARFASLGGWAATDMPMDAFRAGLLVPPELVVYSLTRVRSGNLDWQDVIVVLEAYRPNQALFRRFKLDPHVQTYLDENYRAVLVTEAFTHYVRKGMAMDGLQWDDLRQAMVNLLDRFTKTGIEGGYAGLIDPKTGLRYERAITQDPIGDRTIAMRPAGSTPRVGTCLMRLSALTGERRFQDAAIAAGRAVVCAQSRDGGWPPAAKLADNCAAVEPPESPQGTNDNDSLDEGGPAQAISFLLSLRSANLDPTLAALFEKSARAGLDFLVNAQNPDGGWPLKLSAGDYSRYSTLNDGVTTAAIGILVRGFTEFSVPRYRDAALRGVQFLLDRQAPEGPWAQQYDADGKPVAARAFEPAAYASLETARALQVLIEFYRLTEAPELLAAINRGRDWLLAHTVGYETWSRFYEIGTDRPIFGDRDGSVHYQLSEISAERAAGYRWIERFPEVIRSLRLAEAANASVKRIPSAKASLSRTEAADQLLLDRPLLRAVATADGADAELDASGMISTRKLVETCEAIMPALELTGL